MYNNLESKESSMITYNGKKFIKSKPHPFIAGICDFYLLSIFIGLMFSIITSVIGQTLSNPMSIPLIINVTSLVVIIMYHKIISKKVLWLTPGEHITGKIVIDNEKIWINQHGHKRFIEFTFSILTLVVLGNDLDKLSLGYIYSTKELLIIIIRFILLSSIIVLFGKGKFQKKI